MVLTAQVTHPPQVAITGFNWNFGDGKTVTQKTLQPVTHRYDKPGEYMTTVSAQLAGGEPLVESAEPVYVGAAPAPELIYDLSLREASDWQGPWASTGPAAETLVTYRHLPNRGSAPNPILAVSKIVDDAERGRAVEFRRDDPEGGIWLIRNGDTVMDAAGHPNEFTISLRFKAADTKSRQVLYAEGSHVLGTNVYLEDGKVYVGAWNQTWVGNWLSTDAISPNRWYQVTLVIQDATANSRAEQDAFVSRLQAGGRRPGGSGAAQLRSAAIGRSRTAQQRPDTDEISGRRPIRRSFSRPPERFSTGERGRRAIEVGSSMSDASEFRRVAGRRRFTCLTPRLVRLVFAGWRL